MPRACAREDEAGGCVAVHVMDELWMQPAHEITSTQLVLTQLYDLMLQDFSVDISGSSLMTTWMAPQGVEPRCYLTPAPEKFECTAPGAEC